MGGIYIGFASILLVVTRTGIVGAGVAQRA